MKKTVLSLTLVMVISFLCLFSCGGSGTTDSDRGDGKYIISGNVLYNGNGLEGVAVQLSGNAIQTSYTDDKGYYSFANLPGRSLKNTQDSF